MANIWNAHHLSWKSLGQAQVSVAPRLDTMRTDILFRLSLPILLGGVLDVLAKLDRAIVQNGRVYAEIGYRQRDRDDRDARPWLDRPVTCELHIV